MPIEDDIKKAFELIDKGYKKIDEVNSQEKAVIIIGPTRSGKSLLLNWVFGGADLVAKQKDGEFILEPEPQIEDIEVSSCGVAKTSIPNYFQFSEMAIWDCPGFGDTRKSPYDIVHAFYLEKILNKYRKIKVILVLSHMLLTPDGFAQFKGLLSQLGEVFRNINEVKRGLSIIVTKVPDGITFNNIINAFNQRLEEALQEGDDNVIRVARMFRENMLSLDGDARRISVFKRPNNVTDNFDQNSNKESILKTLVNSTFINVQGRTALTISDRSKLELNEYANHVSVVVLDEVIKMYNKIRSTIQFSSMLSDESRSKEFLKEQDITYFGLTYQPIPGDGHCLYNAVGLYVNEEHRSLRRRVANYIEQHANEFMEKFTAIHPNRNIRDYIEDIRVRNEWADNLEIAVLMKVFNRPIFVVGSDGKIINYADASNFSGEPIFVYYNGHNHYDGLIQTNHLNGQQMLHRFQRTEEFFGGMRDAIVRIVANATHNDFLREIKSFNDSYLFNYNLNKITQYISYLDFFQKIKPDILCNIANWMNPLNSIRNQLDVEISIAVRHREVHAERKSVYQEEQNERKAIEDLKLQEVRNIYAITKNPNSTSYKPYSGFCVLMLYSALKNKDTVNIQQYLAEMATLKTQAGDAEFITHSVGQVAQHRDFPYDVNVAYGEQHLTPLHIAVEHSDKDTVEELLGHQEVEVDKPDANGNTPLHLLAKDRKEKLESQDKLIIPLLLDKGADHTCLNNYAQTAIDIARENKQFTTAKVIASTSSLKMLAWQRNASARLTNIETRLTSVEARVNGAETKLTSVESRVTGTENKLNQAEARLTNAEAAIGGIKNVFNTHNHCLDLPGDTGHKNHSHGCKLGEGGSAGAIKGPRQQM